MGEKTKVPVAGSFEDAAEKAGVSIGEFKVWLAENTKFSGDRWSKWNSGKEPVPADLIIAFLRAKLEEAKRAAAG